MAEIRSNEKDNQLVVTQQKATQDEKLSLTIDTNKNVSEAFAEVVPIQNGIVGCGADCESTRNIDTKWG